MRILWIGGRPPASDSGGPSLRAMDVLAGSPLVEYVRLACQRGGETQAYVACLVDLNRPRPETEAILRAVQEQLQCVPVGLIAGDDQRALALELLKDRMADRIVPRGHIETGLQAHLDALVSHGHALRALRAAWAAQEPRTVLVTGATGFLGGHFLRYLLRCAPLNVIAVCRNGRDTPYDRRLAHLARLHPDRIRYVHGDVRLPGLGLSPAHRALVSESVDEIWHLAAITRFEEIFREEIFRANLTGTENMLAVAESLPRLQRFNHISTAYVAGDPGPDFSVPEARLAPPPAFKNPYEESKFLAEERVIQSGLPAVIYRPSIIMGESVSGLTDGQTVYNVAKMLRLARMGGERAAALNPGPAATSFRVVVDPATSKNLIAVDDVVCRMLHIAAAGPSPGDFYNLVHDTATPMADIIQVIASVLRIHEYEAVASLEGARLSPSEALFQRVSGVFKPYMLKSDPRFLLREATRMADARPLRAMDQTQLHYLLQSFFEQHFDWAFHPVSVPA